MANVEYCAGGIVRNSNDEFLMVKHDVWIFPKGHIEEDETPEEAAVREVEEETGIQIELTGPMANISFQMSENIKKEVTLFLARALNTDIKIDPREIKDARWVPKDEVLNTLGYDDLKEVFRKLVL